MSNLHAFGMGVSQQKICYIHTYPGSPSKPALMITEMALCTSAYIVR